MGSVATGMMFGTLKEYHPGYIVLTDGTRLSLAAGLVLESMGPGAPIRIVYSEDGGGELVVESVSRIGVPKLP